MPTAVIIVIIVAGVGLIVAAIAGYYLARHMRGTIKLTLAKKGFNPGEQVTGSFTMETRKSIEGKRLFVALVGKEITEEHYRDSQGRDSTRTHTREIFRTEQTIEDARTYPAGQVSEHDFQLQTPSDGDDGFFDSELGQALKLGVQILGGERTRLEWKVTARLDAEGIDLCDSERVTINL
jgi:hypothetical protein